MIFDDVMDRVGWDQSFLQDGQSTSDVVKVCASPPPSVRFTSSPLGGHTMLGHLVGARKESIEISETFPNVIDRFKLPAEKETKVCGLVKEESFNDGPDIGELQGNVKTRGIVKLNNFGGGEEEEEEERRQIEFLDKNSVLFISPDYPNLPRVKDAQCVHSRDLPMVSTSSHLLTDDVIAQRSNVFITDRTMIEERSSSLGLTTSTPVGIRSSGLSASECTLSGRMHNGVHNGHVRTFVTGAPITSSTDLVGASRSCNTSLLNSQTSENVTGQLGGQFSDRSTNQTSGQLSDGCPSISPDSWMILNSSNLSERCSPAAPPQHTPTTGGHHTTDVCSPADAPLHTTPTTGGHHADAYSRAAHFLAAWDLDNLKTVFLRLSVCGFYFGKMSIDEANDRLRLFPVGTFLLRNSSDCRYLFALSVQTRRGTTSIRIVYQAGLFRLDSDEEQVHIMPTFDCVLALVRHYVALSCSRYGGGLRSKNDYVFLESSGRKDTPVLLRKPLESAPAPLAHVCRRRIHGLLAGKSVERLHLTPSLKKYLTDYPYDF